MIQPSLLGPSPEVIPSPFCHRWPDCTPKSKAEVGPWEQRDGCRNRPVRCLKCGVRGEQSEDTARGKR